MSPKTGILNILHPYFCSVFKAMSMEAPFLHFCISVLTGYIFLRIYGFTPNTFAKKA